MPINPKTLIDLSANPYDLRPAVDGIMARVEEVSKNLRADQPLIVLMGEAHDQPAHMMLQLMVLERLKGRAAFGIELQHNFIEFALKKKFRKVVPEELRKPLGKLDTDGQLALSFLLAAPLSGHTPVAHHTLLDFVRREKISIRFNDAARDPFYLDQSDPETREAVARYAKDKLDKKTFVFTPEAMEVRNRVIVQRALAHKQDSGAEIYVQNCGNLHVAGGREYPFKGSLVDLFKTAGAAVVPVYPLSGYRGNNIPPEAARVMAEEAIAIKGMAERPPSLFSSGEEKLIKKIAQASGLNVRPYTSGWFDKNADSKIIMREVMNELPRWLELAKKLG